MAESLQAQLTAAFGLGEGVGQLLIEPDPNGSPDLDIRLLLFPPVGANLATSAGSVRYGINKTIDVPEGILTFSGSSTAAMPKIPSESNPTFKALFSFNTQGQPTPIGIELDRQRGIVRASAECYAAVSYTAYKTTARELIYSPLVENLGGGTKTTFGVIAAFYPPNSMTVYQVEPGDLDSGNVEVEVYRIVSNAVTTPDGEFERPPNYPAQGSYPDRSLVLDTSQTLETERAHEIGYMDQRGRAWVRSLYVPTKPPYEGDTAYVPTKTCKVSTIPPDLFDKNLIAKALNWTKQRGYGCKGGSGA